MNIEAYIQLTILEWLNFFGHPGTKQCAEFADYSHYIAQQAWGPPAPR